MQTYFAFLPGNIMNDPEMYFSLKEAIGQQNYVFVPQLLETMDWKFKSGNILDYGCGPGNLGYHYFLPLAEQTESQLYSVDISPEMVEYSRKHFPHPRISYKVGSLPDDFPVSVSFDRVIAVHVLHFVRDVRPFLKKMHNILKPGGQFGFTTTTINNSVFRTHAHLIKSPVWKPYMRKLEEYMPEWSKVPKGKDAEEFFGNTFVLGTGLKQVSYFFARQDLVMPVEEYLDFAMSLNPCVTNVPTHLIGQLREDYRMVTTKDLRIPRDSPVIRLPHEYICMVLQK